MNVVIQGRDWSEIKHKKNKDVANLEGLISMLSDKDDSEDNEQSKEVNNLSTDELKDVNSSEDADTTNDDGSPENTDASDVDDTPEDKEQEKDETDKDDWESLGFFKRLVSANDKTISPYNLGLYQKISNKDEEYLWATQYVGIVPLLRNGEKLEGQPVIKILSRFDISPSKMVEEVLSGRDYYENPSMLTTKSYSAYQWRNLDDTYRKEKDKVLFGLVNGIGKLDLLKKGNEDTEGKNDDSDVEIVDAFGVFEIIDFVNKAKDLCRKNLKKQSQRVEENLNCKVKGRILVQKQIKYNAARGQLQKTYCAYNKMSEDIRENQIIKYALHLCQKKQGIGDSLAEDIRFCMNTLRGVPLKKCSASDFVGLKNNGAYKQYKETLESAKKVINRYSISYEPDHSKGDGNQKETKKASIKDGKIIPYFIDMNILFEYYCRALFRKAIDRYNEDDTPIKLELESAKNARRLMFKVEDKYWKRIAAAGIYDDNNDDDDSSDEVGKDHQYFMATYVPDIVINYTGGMSGKTEVAAIFDAKYSKVRGSTESRLRTHQVMFYMKAMDCDYGGLISPAILNRDEDGKASLEASAVEEGEKVVKEKGDNVEVRNIKLNINHCVRDKNISVWEEGEPILFYIPLYDKKDEKDIYEKREEKEGEERLSEYQVDRIKRFLEGELKKNIELKEQKIKDKEFIKYVKEELEEARKDYERRKKENSEKENPSKSLRLSLTYLNNIYKKYFGTENKNEEAGGN